jgi:hypothetical protein
MAGPRIPDGAQKRKRIKKKKSRTEGMSVLEAVMRNVADEKKVSSSDSESEVEQKKSRKSDVVTTEVCPSKMTSSKHELINCSRL